MRKLKRLAKARSLEFRFVADKGKGSHGRIYLGSEFTTVKDRSKEIQPGLLNEMCAQLGIKKSGL